jgi:hypothetical protein
MKPHKQKQKRLSLKRKPKSVKARAMSSHGHSADEPDNYRADHPHFPGDREHKKSR